jgi:serine/threonine protein kinase
MIGRRLRHYQILEKLGEGGMGEVYLAEDPSLGRKVALKFLSEALRTDEVARRRFLAEARSAAALDHPFICKIYETGRADGRDYSGRSCCRCTDGCRPRRPCPAGRSSRGSPIRRPRAVRRSGTCSASR